MNRDLDAMSRRELLRRGGRAATAAGAAAALFSAGVPLGARAQENAAPADLPAATIPESLKGSGEVRVCSWGGAFQAAQREAYFKPFQELSGIEVIEAEGPDVARVKAMVDTGNVEWDVAEMISPDVLNLADEGDYWEPLDYGLFDTANIPEQHRGELYVDMLPYGQVLAYRTDAFPEAPRGWVDFWDTERFPGARTMIGGTGGVSPFLEAALIADGVARDEVYPIDIDRAFASLTRIRDDVVEFWEAGAQPAQMLTDNEAVLAVAWNGRIAAIQDEGVPAEVQWNEGMLDTDVWAIPKGADNAENAQKFAAFITLPASQARLSMLIPYGYVNSRATELIPAERLAILPTAPEILAQMFVRDPLWWVENVEAVNERWNEWVLE